MKINADESMTLETTGRTIGAVDISINEHGETSGIEPDDCDFGSQSISELTISIDGSHAFTFFDNHATNAEKRELAVHMIRRWAKYGGIGTIIAADSHDVRVTRRIYALDLDNEKD
jgi:hypothetical protein